MHAHGCRYDDRKRAGHFAEDGLDVKRLRPNDAPQYDVCFSVSVCVCLCLCLCLCICVGLCMAFSKYVPCVLFPWLAPLTPSFAGIVSISPHLRIIDTMGPPRPADVVTLVNGNVVHPHYPWPVTATVTETATGIAIVIIIRGTAADGMTLGIMGGRSMTRILAGEEVVEVAAAMVIGVKIHASASASECMGRLPPTWTIGTAVGLDIPAAADIPRRRPWLPCPRRPRVHPCACPRPRRRFGGI